MDQEKQKNTTDSIGRNFQELGLSLKEISLQIREIKQYNSEKSLKFRSSISIAQATIIVSVIGFIGTFSGSYLQSWSNLQLKQREFESNLILRAVKTENAETSKNNLRFLLAAGFISDDHGKISNLLADGTYSIQLSPSVSESLTKAITNNDAEMIVREILEKVGLIPNFLVRESASINSAIAMIAKGGERHLVYNPNFLAKLNKSIKSNWMAVFVLAHEIGHHLLGHTLLAGKDKPKVELEADEFSGFILYKLGATLDEAKAPILALIGEKQAVSPYYPSKKERLVAVKSGWLRAKEGRGISAVKQ